MTRTLSLAVVCVLSLAFASMARASVTVGQLFTPSGTGCVSGTELQTGVASGNAYSVPSAGVVTSWSWNAGAETVPDLEFKVARLVSGTDYTIVGTSPAGTQTANHVSTYPTRISVRAGDIIGVYENGGSCGSNTGNNDDTFVQVFPPHDPVNEPLGSTDTYSASQGFLLPVAATVEPDADGDSYGDETQDGCPTDATIHTACPSATTPPVTPPAPVAKDTTPPALTASIARLLKLSKHGSLSFFVTSGENASGSATGTIGLPRSAKVVRFKRAKLNLAAGKRTKVTLKLSKSALKSVRKALAHHRLKARLTITVTDAAGNKRAKKLAARLKR